MYENYRKIVKVWANMVIKMFIFCHIIHCALGGQVNMDNRGSVFTHDVTE